jgi:cell division protein FtsZ
VEAARAAINSPLLEDTKIRGARQVLMNISASADIGLHEVNEACSIIVDASGSDDLQLNFGLIAKPDLGDTVKITIIATGFAKEEERREPMFEPSRPVAASDFFVERAAAPAPSAPHPAPVIQEPAPVPEMPAAAAPVFEDDLDVPAYLRQGKLLN